MGTGDINLIAKIAPKNDAFQGMIGDRQIVGVSGGFKDEDDMASDDDTSFCSQQSIKKYVDDNGGAGSFFGLAVSGPDLSFATGSVTLVGSTSITIERAGSEFRITGVAGGGDVSKVGTPNDDEVGIWTGDGTIEGDSALTFDGTDITCTGEVIGTNITTISGAGVAVSGALVTDIATLVTVSGAGVAVSGALVADIADLVTISGATVTNKDDIITVSGAGLVVSGAYVATSGATTAVSGAYVNTSGSWLTGSLSTELGSIAGFAGSLSLQAVSGAGFAGSLSLQIVSGALFTVEGTAILSTGEGGGTKFLREDGDDTCSWQSAAGGGDVSKVGTPNDDEVGVWTGDGTIEGDAALTFDGTDLTCTGEVVGTNITTISGAGLVVSGAYVVTSGALVTDIANLVTVSGAGVTVSGALVADIAKLVTTSGAGYAGSVAGVLNTNHRNDNTQAHTDYLLNSAGDSGVGLYLSQDNSTADRCYTPMVLFNTDATPPTASNTPRGTIYVQYTA